MFCQCTTYDLVFSYYILYQSIQYLFIFSLGIYTGITGVLGITANSLAIFVFIKSKKVDSECLFKKSCMSCCSILVKNSIQLVADEPLCHWVGDGHNRQSNPLLQLFLWSLEFLSDNLQDKCSRNDISGYILIFYILRTTHGGIYTEFVWIPCPRHNT